MYNLFHHFLHRYTLDTLRLRNSRLPATINTTKSNIAAIQYVSLSSMTYCNPYIIAIRTTVIIKDLFQSIPIAMNGRIDLDDIKTTPIEHLSYMSSRITAHKHIQTCLQDSPPTIFIGSYYIRGLVQQGGRKKPCMKYDFMGEGDKAL